MLRKNNKNIFFSHNRNKKILSKSNLKPFNNSAADTTNTEYLRDDLGLKGEGLTAGVYDIYYVRGTHQEFRTSNVDTSSRVSFPTDLDTSLEGDHATHVAGTIGAFGVQSQAKGMAPAINIYSFDVGLKLKCIPFSC